MAFPKGRKTTKVKTTKEPGFKEKETEITSGTKKEKETEEDEDAQAEELTKTQGSKIVKDEKGGRKKEDEAKDNHPSERVTAVGGSALPVNEVPTPTSTITPPPPATSSESTLGGPALTSSAPIIEWRVAKTVPSILSLSTTSYHHNMYWHSTEQIGDFTDPLSFYEAHYDLVHRVKDMYDYLLIDVDNRQLRPGELSTTWRRVTTPGALGFNLETLNTVPLKDPQRRENYDFLLANLAGNEDSRHPTLGRYKIFHQYVGLQEEFNILELAQQRSDWYLVEISEILQFVALWNTRDKRLKHPEPSTINPLLMKYPFRGLTPCYEHIMDRSSITRRMMIDAMQLWIGSNVMISPPQEKEEHNVWLTFAHGLQVSTTTFSAVNEFPSRLTYRAGSDMARALITALAMGKWAEIEMDIPMDILDISVVMSCIHCKILLPYHIVAEHTIRDIDNYLFKYFIPLFPELTIQYRDTINRIQIGSRTSDSNNYLTQFFANDGDFAFANRPDIFNALKEWLNTDGAGGGWNYADQNAPVIIPQQARRFIGPNRWLRCSGYFGVAGGEESAKLEQFERGMRVVSLTKMSSSPNMYARPIGKILETAFTGGTRGRTRSMRVYINYVLERLGLLAMTAPLDPQDRPFVVTGNKRERIPIKIDGPVSMIWNIDWAVYMTRNGFDNTLFETGLAVNDYFTNLTASYHYIEDKFKRSEQHPELVHFTSTDRYRKMLDKIVGRISISGALEALLGAKPHLYDLREHIPDKELIGYERLPHIMLLKESEKLIEKYPHFFGYVPKFYMVHGYPKDVYEKDSRLFEIQYKIKDSAKIKQRLTFDDLVKALTENEGYYKLVRSLEQDEVIEFDFPVKFTSKPVKDDCTIEETNNTPFITAQLGESMSNLLKKLQLIYRFKDDLVYAHSNGAAHRWIPLFGVKENLPFLPQADIPFSSILHRIECWKGDTIRIWKDFEFIGM